MKIVLDCNVLISAGLINGNCRNVLMEVLHSHTNYVSDDIIREFRNVIFRKKFEPYKLNLVELLKLTCTLSTWIEKPAPNKEFTLPDIHDQIYLDLALEVSAHYIITGNAKDFPLGNYNLVQIITPQKFLQKI